VREREKEKLLKEKKTCEKKNNSRKNSFLQKKTIF